MATLRTEPVQRGLDGLARAGLDWPTFVGSAIDVLERAIPFEAACMGPVDPETGLITGSVKKGLPDDHDAEFLEHEYLNDHVNLFTSLARRESPVGILVDDTHGDPRTSSRYRDFFVPYFDLGHEMRGSAVADGQAWAAVALYRAAGSSGFSPAEADFLARVTRTIAVGVRAGLVVSGAQVAEHPDAASSGPAVLVVDGTNTVLQASPAAQERIAELGGSVWQALPTPVASIAAAARALGQGRTDVVPRLRVRTPAGQWLVVHASPLAGRDGRGSQVVVTIEDARPMEVVPLVVAAFGLTGRERDVVAAVLQGHSTQEIGRTLHLSPYTVQDHLKVVFDKAGVSSRRELVARVFFDHYGPRYGNRVAPSGWFASAPAPPGPAAVTAVPAAEPALVG